MFGIRGTSGAGTGYKRDFRNSLVSRLIGVAKTQLPQTPVFEHVATCLAHLGRRKEGGELRVNRGRERKKGGKGGDRGERGI